ncbi:MAG: GGDEF domain-containing protein [Oscillospiraceae bacterium]|nr:GGDEF domain-containing protein [Oscillospiraceae bacterium]
MKEHSGRHKVIGIVCAGLHDTGAQNAMLAIIKEAEARGYKVIVFTNFTYYHIEYTPAEVNIFKLIGKPVLDGLILMPETIKSTDVWEMVLADAKATGLPFVCVDRDVPDCVSITFDYGGAFEQVMRHMVEVHKPKRINFIGGMENNSFSDERLNVFKKVLADNGLDFDPERFGYGDFWETPTLEVLDKFYTSGQEPPDAILCVNDTEAMTTCNYLRKKGIDVPRDVIVNGFDGIEEEKYTFPRLTTAEIDLDGMSDKTLDLLEQLMSGEQVTERLTVIPYTLRISQSCGCKPIEEGEKVNKLLDLFVNRKDLERHERRMFEYCAHTESLDSYDQLAKLLPFFCECPTWCCIETDLLHDDDDDKEQEDYLTTGTVASAVADARKVSGADTAHDPDMTMVAHCRNKGNEQFEDTYVFDVPIRHDEILPDLDSVFDDYGALLIAPMSYQGNSMGYMAAAMDSEGFNFLFTQRIISNTNQIFETLKTKIRLQKAYAKVADMHMRDPMTGIYNRRGFYMRMAELTESGTTSFSLFSVDLDRLKYINDTFGHYAGDKAIIMAADIVHRAAGQGAVCARFGGDEFIVVIPDGEDAVRYIDRVNEEAEAVNASGKEPFRIGVSIGRADLRITDRENIDTAMKAADEKMYECKRRHHAERR